ncbi:MAG TPA: tetratricopeptide repeat protein [Gemmataceae bacterium]|jgi:tetratricopeptide (TPR) repeat protein|nr:tetratricopeptide repeat protein [Gemmataceae bacterium]
MRICSRGEHDRFGKNAWRFAALAIAGMQWGCALSGNDGQTMTSALLAPFGAASKEAPQTPAQACIAAGQKLEHKGHLKEAIAKYEEARRFDPKAPVAHALALLYDKQGDVERAQAEFAIALKAAPKDAEVLVDMAYFSFEHGNFSESEKLLRQALALKPDNERAWVALGLVLGRQGHYEESYDAFARILSRDEAHANQDAIAAKLEKSPDAPKLPHPIANLSAPQQDSAKASHADAEPMAQP